MTTELQTPSRSLLASMLQPDSFRVDDADREFFRRELAGFVPPGSFDAHVHLYDFAHVDDVAGVSTPETAVGYDVFVRRQRAWMGDLAPTDGLFFGFPRVSVDMDAANRFLMDEIRPHPGSRGQMLIRPQNDPAEVEALVEEQGWAGFKPYHVYADRDNTFYAENEEFLPDWAWEIADRHGLAITLHIVLPRALADERNQKYINEHCKKYPGAKLILAHSARSFCSEHTVEGIGAITGLDNVYFDTSAICESSSFEAILRVYGAERLLYGSDFPVSEAHGRCITLGDGFHWIYESERESWPYGPPALIGLESLRALKQACRNVSLGDTGIELIFRDNARKLLGLYDRE